VTDLLASAAIVSRAPRPEDLRECIHLGSSGSYRQRRATGVHDTLCSRA
jgi:hypothetical protein